MMHHTLFALPFSTHCETSNMFPFPLDPFNCYCILIWIISGLLLCLINENVFECSEVAAISLSIKQHTKFSSLHSMSEMFGSLIYFPSFLIHISIVAFQFTLFLLLLFYCPWRCLQMVRRSTYQNLLAWEQFYGPIVEISIYISTMPECTIKQYCNARIQILEFLSAGCSLIIVMPSHHHFPPTLHHGRCPWQTHCHSLIHHTHPP